MIGLVYWSNICEGSGCKDLRIRWTLNLNGEAPRERHAYSIVDLLWQLFKKKAKQSPEKSRNLGIGR